jgi:hypothetical protein
MGGEGARARRGLASGVGLADSVNQRARSGLDKGA